MARYNLIIKDSIYVRLVQHAAQEGKSLGKLLNEILDEFVRKLGMDGHVAVGGVCVVCGKKANAEFHGKGQQKLFVCKDHIAYFKRFMQGYREF